MSGIHLCGTRARSVRLLVVMAMLAALIAVPQTASAAFITTAEVEPNGTPAEATAIVVGDSICEAAINPAGDEDYYKFDLTAGTTYLIETGPSTTDLGTNYDIVMWLYDTDGVSQLNYDDDAGPINYSHFEFTPATSGTYYTKIRAFGHGSTTGLYGFRVREAGVAAGGGTATISGVVEDADGPVAGIEVQDYLVDPWFAVLDSSFSSMGAMAVTGADGTYEMTVDEGTHWIQFTEPAGAYFEQWFDGQPSMDTANTIELAADDTTTTIDAFLEKVPPIATKVIDTARASVDADGQEYGDGGESRSGSRTSDISADGRYVVFYSGASLVPEDNGEYRDWFRKDMETGEIELVSVNSDGEQANGDYNDGDGKASISADGRYIAFDSDATNLDPDTGNFNGTDVYVRDMELGTTRRVSWAPDLGDGGIGGGWDPSISGDGEYVVFTSASELVAGDTNSMDDVYMCELDTGEITRVSESVAGNDGEGASWYPDVNYDGSFVSFRTDRQFVEDDSGAYADVYVKDIEAGTFARASVASDGTEADYYGYDTPAISADGMRVVFDSEASNLVPDDTNEETDVFLHDFSTGETTRVSVRSDGSESWSGKHDPAISADGRFVAFSESGGGKGGPQGPSSVSAAAESTIFDTLVPGDINEREDILLHDTADGSTTMVSVTPMNTQTHDDSEHPAVSGDGSFISYDGWADNLVPDDNNGVRDVFVASIQKNTETPVDGSDRYETAIEISQELWPDGSEFVIVARGDNWPDALGGSALAGAVDAPVLLTPSTELLPDVADEIDRLGATDVYVLGGTAAISDGVFADIQDLVGEGTVTRLGGADRYRTAEIVAAEVVDLLGAEYDGTAFVATGENFADALAASPLAAASGWPVYLAPHPVISDETVAAMQDAGVIDCVLLGGDAAMPEGTNVVILAAGFDAIRIDGVDRYETAAKVAGYGVSDAGLAWNDVAIATGQTFPDALSGGAAQGRLGSVMLLATKTAVPAYTSDAITDHKLSIANVRFLGGLNALSQDVRDEITQLLQ